MKGIIMNIQEQFNKVAEEYDKNRKFFIPCFDDFYKTATNIATVKADKPISVLDLGAGTGLLSKYWFDTKPNAQYYLMDIATNMLEVAQKRFNNLDNFHFLDMDYTNVLPENDFDVIISALSIHHLEDTKKEELFSRIYEKIPVGGIFVNYDQFCASSSEIDDVYNKFWENQLFESELSSHDIELWQERRKLDRECSVDAEIDMLRNSGFKSVECIYSYHKFSVLLSVK